MTNNEVRYPLNLFFRPWNNRMYIEELDMECDAEDVMKTLSEDLGFKDVQVEAPTTVYRWVVSVPVSDMVDYMHSRVTVTCCDLFP